MTRDHAAQDSAPPRCAAEANFDGLVGPTHHYFNIAPGNRASETGRGEASQPRAALLQGLAKARTLADLGLPQAVLPPNPRPNLGLLRALGFSGTLENVLDGARRHAPHLLGTACSSAFMWTANAGTVAPSADTPDGRLRITPANLSSAVHRWQEHASTAAALRAIFHDPEHFEVLDPLPTARDTPDEGAANHSRFSAEPAGPGVHHFVYGVDLANPDTPRPQRYHARQTRAASEAVARRHGLAPERCVFTQQSPVAIDAGVFHNDVIAVGGRETLLLHEDAFLDQNRAIDQLVQTVEQQLGVTLRIGLAERQALPLEEAVRTYLFNSQLVTPPGQTRPTLVCPTECEASPGCRSVIERWTDAGVIAGALYVDVRQSMKNGGGPACLRLRVEMTAEEQVVVAPGVWLTPDLHNRLTAWAERYYPESVVLDDLADPAMARNALDAVDELTRNVLRLGDVFDVER
ncbi:MAG: N-succinylarginine dihydrolase [Planctomycetota bacterium]